MNQKITFLILLSVFIGLSTFAQISTDGLVAYYPFNGNANDESGNGHNGTVSGATLTTDRFGNCNKAYNFSNSMANYINLTPTGLNLNQYSYSAWVYLNSFPVSGSRYTVLSIGSVTGDQFIDYDNNYTPASVSYNGWGFDNYYGNMLQNTIYSGNTASLSQWYHLVSIKSATSFKVYINGTLLDSVTTTSAPFYGTGTLKAVIGSRYNNTLLFDGKIDDIRIYNRALKQNEISALYNEVPNTCTRTVTDTLVINANITGFNPITYQNNIKVYPNPTNDKITIDCGSNFSTMNGYSIKITNSLSSIVYNELVNKQITSIDLKSWTGKGIYFVHLIDGNSNTIDIRKIVLQ